jgi:hypothetical protein
MLLASWVLAAGQARVTPSQVQSQEQEILIMSEDSRDLLTIRVLKDPRPNYWYPGPHKMYQAGEAIPVVSGLALSAWREGQTVKFKLTALIGKWIYNVPPSAVKRIEVGTYSIHDSAPMVIDDGVKHGLPVLHFRLGRQVNQCPGDPSSIENLTTSLKVKGFPASGGFCYLLLRNDSIKGVISVRVDRKKPGISGRAHTWGTSGDPLGAAMIASGATYSYPTAVSAKPGETADLAQEQLSINSVVFEDGTYEGDEAAAMKEIGYRVGFYAAMARFTPLLRETLANASARSEDSELLDDLKGKLISLPSFDEEASHKAETQFKPRNPVGFRSSVTEGMRFAKNTIDRRIEGYAKDREANRWSFRSYWSSFLSDAEAAVTRWNLVAGDAAERNSAKQTSRR